MNKLFGIDPLKIEGLGQMAPEPLPNEKPKTI